MSAITLARSSASMMGFGIALCGVRSQTAGKPLPSFPACRRSLAGRECREPKSRRYPLPRQYAVTLRAISSSHCDLEYSLRDWAAASCRRRAAARHPLGRRPTKPTLSYSKNEGVRGLAMRERMPSGMTRGVGRQPHSWSEPFRHNEKCLS